MGFSIAWIIGSEEASQHVEPVRLRERLERARVDVHPASGPRRVTADRSHATRILSNLLNNSLTYSRQPAQVVVEVRVTSPVEVAVHDSGVGITPEWHDRVFERFGRYGDGGVDHASGLGLGLSISRDLPELNGGELFIERSAPGEGSVFVMRLPAVDGQR